MDARPLCSACCVRMECYKNEVVVVDHAEDGPVTLTEGDEWRCPCCLHRIVIGFARDHLAEAMKNPSRFQRVLEMARANEDSRDCYQDVETAIRNRHGDKTLEQTIDDALEHDETTPF